MLQGIGAGIGIDLMGLTPNPGFNQNILICWMLSNGTYNVNLCVYTYMEKSSLADALFYCL